MKLPFTKKQIGSLPTPVYIYDEKGIRETAKQLKKAFSIFPGFKEYFAVKALPNPFILKVLKSEGFGTDCSSLPELMLAEKIGLSGEEIMFTSNHTKAEEFVKAKELGAVINLDDITHIDFVKKACGLPGLVSCRYNPGPRRGGNVIIGNPAEAKFGMTHEQVFDAYAKLKKEGVKRFGLHTMVVSNELNEEYLIETGRMLFQLALDVHKKVGVTLEFINLGGGFGIPYKPEQKAIDMERVASEIHKAYESILLKNNLKPRIYLECGRLVTGPHGYLVTKVLHVEEKYRKIIGVDATIANLMRPAMYGAYHHITVLGKENEKLSITADVVGSLCENNDKFAIQRALPAIALGDILVLHSTGAHGHAMGFNYNGKLRSAEYLMRPDGTFTKIRRAETVEDYFATLDF
ncbi:diaminopimelate decarboxylase [Candidatus Woesearchaeota archaeon]|nr:diaminopimelate decarboxylase [Candidatus Woesearchaeota archaeon]